MPDDSDAVRPATVAELDQFKDNDDFWDEGTHSILDTDRIVPSDSDDEQGAIRPLPDDEIAAYFHTSEPSRTDFNAAYENGAGPLGESSELRWSGRCTLLYNAGVAAEVAFWGFSGD